MTQSPPVTFDQATWLAIFPEFTPLTEAQGQSYFNRATAICLNSINNPIWSFDGTGAILQEALYLLTSHIAWLNCPKDANGNPAATGQAASPLVGRISDASEGSVSVAVDMGDANAASPNQAWYEQTKYGSEYFMLTAPARTARYLARPTIVVNGAYPGLWGPGGFYRR